MHRNIIKYIIIAILYVVMIIELVVIFHTFEHYKEASEKANTNNTQVEEQVQPGNIEKVRERNNFYTVVSCANKYLEYLYKKEAKNVYDCLDQSYIEEKEITENNVLDRLEGLDTKSSFVAEKMYEQKISNDTTQYYAYGKLVKDTETQDTTAGKDFYISIKINRTKVTFTVLPDTYIN